MPKSSEIKTLVQAVFVGSLALIAYLLTTPNFITLEDAGLFQMVCHLGGISHPPGYPLFTLLCQQFTIFPSIKNGNLISATFAVGAIMVFFLVVIRLTEDRILAMVAALAYAFSNTFWSQAIIIEVYSLAALMFMLSWLAAVFYLKTAQTSHWYLLCFLVGLALCNHWPLMLLSCPALLLTVLPRWESLWCLVKKPVFWFFSLLCFSLGLLPYLSLLMAADPEISVYGGVTSVEEFVRYVSRSAYSDDHAVADGSHKVAYLFWLAEESMYQLGLLGAPLIVTGFVHALRTRDWFENASVILMFLGSTFLLLALLNFEFSAFYQAIFRPYPVIAYSALCLWFAYGTRLVVNVLLNAADESHIPEKVPADQVRGFVFMIVGFASLVTVYLSNYEKVDRSRSRFIDTYARTVLETLPADSILFTYGDNQSGPIGYLNRVEKLRPDVEVRDWANLIWSNRLSSPYISPDAQLAVIEEFINSSSRPVYSVGARLSPSTNLGLYHRFNATGGATFEFKPEIAAYLDSLLQLYLDDQLIDGHEQHFLFNQLIAFSRQYVGYAMSMPISEINPNILIRLNLLQSTFPGKLVTLEHIFKQYQLNEYQLEVNGVRQREVLVQLAAEAEADIPHYASLQSLAVFYELVGRVHALSPDSIELSIEYYRRSIEAWPVNANTSICPLAQIYLDGPNEKAYDGLVYRFPDYSCQ